MAKTSQAYKENLNKVSFFTRVKAYDLNLKSLRNNILKVIDMHDAEKKSFEQIARFLKMPSKITAYMLYKANIKDYKKIKEHQIK